MKPLREFSKGLGVTRTQELLLADKAQRQAAEEVDRVEALLSRRRAEAAQANALVSVNTDPTIISLRPALGQIVAAGEEELQQAQHRLTVARQAMNRLIEGVVRRRSHVDELTAEIAKLEAERKKAQQWLSE